VNWLRWGVLRLAAGVALLQKGVPQRGDPDRVLLIRPDHLGDLLFVTPTLRFLREAMPGAHLTLLVGPWGKPVVARNPNLDEVLTCDFPWFNRRPRRSPLEPYALAWRGARRLRDGCYGTAVVLRPDHWWGAMLSALAGISRRIGYDLPLARSSLTEAVAYVPGTHAVYQNLRLAEALAGREARDFQPALEFVVPAEAMAFADRYLAERGIAPGETLVALQPGSGASIKGWTADGFASVARHVQQTHRARVLITGSAQERPLAEAIAQRMPVPPVIAAGDTDLDGLAALLRRCCLAVGVDSGPLHLAVALGTPTVHLFGPADPTLFGPFGPPERHLVARAALPCVPCGHLDRPLPAAGVADCMRAITVEQVVAAVDRLMDQSATIATAPSAHAERRRGEVAP
jgi:heptosyltransferase-2/heptosyltransferase-3